MDVFKLGVADKDRGGSADLFGLAKAQMGVQGLRRLLAVEVGLQHQSEAMSGQPGTSAAQPGTVQHSRTGSNKRPYDVAAQARSWSVPPL